MLIGYSERRADDALWVERVAFGIEQSKPAEIVGQVLGGDAMESRHPGFRATVIGVDVLDVKDPVLDPNALRQIERLMGDIGFLSEGLVDGQPIGASAASRSRRGLSTALSAR